MNTARKWISGLADRFATWLTRGFQIEQRGGYAPDIVRPEAEGDSPKAAPWLPKPPPKNPSAPAGHVWRAMPGNRLELGATGFAIEMRPLDDLGGNAIGYRAFNPEGLSCWQSLVDLPGLKRLCEQQARYREEFQQ